MVRLESQPLVLEIKTSRAIAVKELSLSSWCIALIHIYHCSDMVDLSSENAVVLPDRGTPGTSK